MNQNQRFSVQAFQFLTQHRFVYIHCDLVVCNANNYNSICARRTTCTNHEHRDVDPGLDDDDNSQKYELSFGPFIKSNASNEKGTGDSASFNAPLVGSLVGVACLILLLIAGLVFIFFKKYRLQRGPQQSLVEKCKKKETLAMDNLAYS